MDADGCRLATEESVSCQPGEDGRMQCERIQRAWRPCPGQPPVLHKEERSQVDANDSQRRLPGRLGDERADAMMQQMQQIEQLVERSFGGGLFGPLFGGSPFGGFGGTLPPDDRSPPAQVPRRTPREPPRAAQPNHQYVPPAMKVEEV